MTYEHICIKSLYLLILQIGKTFQCKSVCSFGTQCRSTSSYLQLSNQQSRNKGSYNAKNLTFSITILEDFIEREYNYLSGAWYTTIESQKKDVHDHEVIQTFMLYTKQYKNVKEYVKYISVNTYIHSSWH